MAEKTKKGIKTGISISKTSAEIAVTVEKDLRLLWLFGKQHNIVS